MAAPTIAAAAAAAGWSAVPGVVTAAAPYHVGHGPYHSYHGEAWPAPQTPLQEAPGTHTDPQARARLGARIAALERAKAALVEAGADANYMGDTARQIGMAKADITAQKPIGARLDSGRAALGRADQREQEATAQVDTALRAAEEAARLAQQRRDELRTLEAELARPTVASGGPAEATHGAQKNLLGDMMTLLATAGANPGATSVAEVLSAVAAALA